MMSSGLEIVPSAAKWARETSGLSLAEAARRLSLKVERLGAIEDGSNPPSSSQLQKMADVYRRPLVSFFLESPPVTDESTPAFRASPGVGDRESSLVAAFLRDIRLRQSVARELLDDESAPPSKLLRMFKARPTVEDAVAGLTRRLNFDRIEYRKQRDEASAFRYLRKLVEETGVFVMVLSNLGSHHSSLSVELFRGISLSDSLAPFIVVNGNDSTSSRCFTLLHEVVHLSMGETQISTWSDGRDAEVFCDRVASAMLLDSEELKSQQINVETDIQNLAKQIGNVAAQFRVSSTMVSYRLFLSKRIPLKTWFDLRQHFVERWAKSKEAQKERAANKSGGPSYYTTQRSYVGPALLSLSARALDSGSATPQSAALMLGVSLNSVYTMVHRGNG
jgi:Zn-dependent peptidase ImmA (M78 family)